MNHFVSDVMSTLEVGDEVEYNSPANSRWLGDSVISAVNPDGTYVVNVRKFVRRVETKPSVKFGYGPGDIKAALPISIGEEVEYHSPTNARWLDGSVISAVHGDGTFQIDVWKNTRNGLIVETKPGVVIGTSPGTIRRVLSVSIGDGVEYNSPTNQRWMGNSTITGLNDDGSVSIEVVKRVEKVETKNGVIIGTNPRNIRLAGPSFSIGDRVDYNSPTNEHWIDNGVISAVNADGSYDVDLWFMKADGPLCQHRPSLIPGDAYRNIRHQASGKSFHPEVLEVLERQMRQSSAQANEVRAQLQQVDVSNTSEIERMKEDMYRMQQEAENARQTKLQMEQEMAAMGGQLLAMQAGQGSPAGPNYNVQDSAIGGDMHIGTTHNTTTYNDPEAIARAAIEAYRMAKEDQR